MNTRIFFNLTVPHYLILIIFTTTSALLVLNPTLIYSTAPKLALTVVSLSFAVFGLNALNQIYDIEIDRISKPHRPIPSGKISIRSVYIFSAMSFFIAFILSLFSRTTPLVIFFVFLSVIYSVPPIRLKRYGISSNIVGGTLYGAVPFLSAAAITGSFSLAFFVFFYGAAIVLATFKDFEDMPTERRLGIRTLPVMLGYERAKQFVVYSLFSLLIFMLLSTGLIRSIFILPTLASLLLLSFIGKMNFNVKNVVSQSPNVTKGMVIIVLMEIAYGITSFFAGLPVP